MYKTATPAQERSSRYYGWESLAEEPAPRQLYAMPPSSVPGAPQWESIQLRPLPDGEVHVALRWKPSSDDDGDLLGYRVMASRHSRGWGYNGKTLPDHLMGFKSHAAGWRPEMYEARFTLPKSEIFLVQIPGTAAEITLTRAGDHYITVMPYDAHGERAGQELYPMSEEIRVDVPESDER